MSASCSFAVGPRRLGRSCRRLGLLSSSPWLPPPPRAEGRRSLVSSSLAGEEEGGRGRRIRRLRRECRGDEDGKGAAAPQGAATRGRRRDDDGGKGRTKAAAVAAEADATRSKRRRDGGSQRDDGIPPLLLVALHRTGCCCVHTSVGSQNVNRQSIDRSRCISRSTNRLNGGYEKEPRTWRLPHGAGDGRTMIEEEARLLDKCCCFCFVPVFRGWWGTGVVVSERRWSMRRLWPSNASQRHCLRHAPATQPSEHRRAQHSQLHVHAADSQRIVWPRPAR